MIEVVRRWFASEEWAADIDDAEGLALAAVEGEHGRWTIAVRVDDESAVIVVHSVCPVRSAPGRNVAMMEAVTRANAGLPIGNFEIDLDDGEIRFKTSLDSEGDALVEANVGRLVIDNVLTMDQYLPAFDAVARGVEPSRAIEAVEAGPDEA